MEDRSASTLVPATFTSRAAAEGAINDLRALGFTNDDLGVAVPDALLAAPREEIVDTEEASGVTTGALIGGPVGAIAGIALSTLLPAGLGLGVGGMLLGAASGTLWGLVVGGFAGLLGKMQQEEEPSWSEIPLSHEDILLIVRAGDRVREAHDAITRHGGRCLCVLDRIQRQSTAR